MSWSRTGLLPAVVFILAAAILSSCGSGRGGDNQSPAGLAPALLTPVAAAEKAGVAAYWLGPSFEADSVVFDTREAKFPEGIAGVAVTGLEVRYSSGEEPGGLLYVDVFPESEWTKVEDKVRNPRVPGVTTKAVTVASWEGQLLFLPFATRPINALRLVLNVGDAVIVAEVLAGGAIYPGGPDYNPFINNPDLLVQVLNDNLRRYPE